LKTVSITMFEKNEENIHVFYKDLLFKVTSELRFNSATGAKVLSNSAEK